MLMIKVLCSSGQELEEVEIKFVYVSVDKVTFVRLS